MDSIPFDYASAQAPLIVVEGRIGEAPDVASVVVDTGASASFPLFIGTDYARRLGLTLSDEVVPLDSTVVGPRQQGYRTSRVSRFTLGPAKLGPVNVAVLPMIDAMQAQVGRRIDAIIGYDFLRERIFAIDYTRQRINLNARPERGVQEMRFALAPAKPLILVEATVNGIGPFTMELDSGATVTTLSPTAAAKARLSVHGQGTLGGAGGTVAAHIGSASVALGTVNRALDHVTITEAMTAISTAAGTRIDGIIGTDFFRQTRLTIDYPNLRLWIRPTE